MCRSHKMHILVKHTFHVLRIMIIDVTILEQKVKKGFPVTKMDFAPQRILS